VIFFFFSRLFRAKPDVPVVVIVNHMDQLEKSIDFFNEEEVLNKRCNTLRDRVKEFKKKYPHIKSMVGTRLGNFDDPNFKPMGFDAVYAKTLEELPDGSKIAFASNVRTSENNRTAASIGIILSGTGAAIGGAFIPIPGVDTVVITTSQIVMTISLFGVWGVAGRNMTSFAISFLKGFATGAIALGVGYVASTVLAEALKLIPGIGTAIGIAVDSSIAGSFTFILGISVLLYLRFHVSAKISEMTEKELEKSVKNFIKKADVVSFAKNAIGKNPEEINRMIDNYTINQ
jgi:uncharacterized protein (DUF697 family)